MEVAIVGMGCVLPQACSVPKFFENLQQKRCAIRSVPTGCWNVETYHADTRPSTDDTCYCTIGAFVEDFESVWKPLEWRLPIPPNVDASIDLQHKYAICATRQALMDCDYINRCRDKLSSTGVVMGVMSGSGNQAYRTAARIYAREALEALAKAPALESLGKDRKAATLEALAEEISRRFPACTSNAHAGEFGNCTAGRIASLFDFKGPNFTVDAACASSFAALRAACDMLLSGRCHAVVVGASEAQMDVHHYVKYSKLGALSPDGCYPFDERANGFVMGEGAVSFVIKTVDDARRDGDTIQAVVRGVGGSSDGRGKSMTAPTVAGQILAIQDAWQQAGLSPRAGLYVEAHGTGTKLGDPIEVESLAAFLSERGLAPKSVGIGSVKANVGHLRSCAGAVGLLKAVLMLRHQTHLAMPGFRQAATRLNLESTPLYVLDGTADAAVPQACVNSFGFGGSNWHVVASPGDA